MFSLSELVHSPLTVRIVAKCGGVAGQGGFGCNLESQEHNSQSAVVMPPKHGMKYFAIL